LDHGCQERGSPDGHTYDEAAITFGCHPETMRRHYLVIDEVAIADAVLERVQKDKRAEDGSKTVENGPKSVESGSGQGRHDRSQEDRNF
jgi:hypothetical protein